MKDIEVLRTGFWSEVKWGGGSKRAVKDRREGGEERGGGEKGGEKTRLIKLQSSLSLEATISPSASC